MRLILPGVAVHVIQRGVNRTACFLAEADYLVYLSHLRQLSAKHDCAVHAYCLMTNHVHLLLTPATAESCTALMRDLGRRYVPYFNSRHERTGTLWEGRFRSCIAESARYVLACYRYIELNPVRAGMVNHPSAYLWSSYAVNSGTRSDPFVSPHLEFLALAAHVEKRYTSYRALFEGEMDQPLLEAIRDATNGGYPLVSDTFKTTAIAPLGWKTAPGRPGPRSNSGPDPEFGKRVRTLTPN
ncbi:MAG TPA: transposase [Burkholderiales bacterium]|nr:transposase [Burkholderiales bacterium]